MKLKSYKKKNEGTEPNAAGFRVILSCHLPTLSSAHASASFFSVWAFWVEIIFLSAVGCRKLPTPPPFFLYVFFFLYGQVQGKGEHIKTLKGRTQGNTRSGPWSQTENAKHIAKVLITSLQLSLPVRFQRQRAIWVMSSQT